MKKLATFAFAAAFSFAGLSAAVACEGHDAQQPEAACGADCAGKTQAKKSAKKKGSGRAAKTPDAKKG